MKFKKAQAEGKKVWFQYADGKWRADAGFCDFTRPVERYSLNPPSAKEYKVFLDACFVFTDGEVPEWAKQVYFTSTDIKAAFRWCTEHNKFADVARAWEEGKQIQFLNNGHWADCIPTWNLDTEYRVKPASIEWTDLKLGDVICKQGQSAIVIGIDADDRNGLHINIDGHWISDRELREYWTKE